MSKTKIIGTVLLGGLALAGVARATADGPAPAARINLAQAREIALRAAPGRVISEDYENEAGGWRYSFDIQQAGHIQEVGVDGQTGRIVENVAESAESEAAEAQGDEGPEANEGPEAGDSD
jgi:lipopolysaccharide export LptBFGC system permease protein LptF